MPVQVEWLIPKRVVISRFWGVISLADMESLLAQQQNLVKEGTPLVHNISDGLQIRSIEISLKTFQLLMKGVPKSERFGWHIDVTTNPLNRMTSALVSQFAGVKMRTYSTVQEALTIPQRERPQP